MNFRNIILTMPDSIFSQRGRVFCGVVDTEVMGDTMDRIDLVGKLILDRSRLTFFSRMKRIKNGTINGTEIPLATLGIVNGL